MKTLKWKEIYANDCRNLEPLVENVETFIEHYYSRCRLHSFFESSSFFALMRLVCVSFEPWTVKPGGKGSFCWRVNSTRKLYFSVNPLLSMIGRVPFAFPILVEFAPNTNSRDGIDKLFR
jgi:hypothetical protein